jgi:ribosomal protein RSM22 (predicted rRNA methylase)
MQQLREQEEREHQEQLQEEQQKGAKPATAAATEPAAAAVAAHVVAPCPHDGGCPLEGRPSWCHFVQRFQASWGKGAGWVYFCAINCHLASHLY